MKTLRNKKTASTPISYINWRLCRSTNLRGKFHHLRKSSNIAKFKRNQRKTNKSLWPQKWSILSRRKLSKIKIDKLLWQIIQEFQIPYRSQASIDDPWQLLILLNSKLLRMETEKKMIRSHCFKKLLRLGKRTNFWRIGLITNKEENYSFKKETRSSVNLYLSDFRLVSKLSEPLNITNIQIISFFIIFIFIKMLSDEAFVIK